MNTAHPTKRSCIATRSITLHANTHASSRGGSQGVCEIAIAAVRGMITSTTTTIHNNHNTVHTQ